MEFLKMHGLGNDFIVVDTRHQDIDLAACNWRLMANRREGIGCDQILVLSEGQAGATAAYEVWNADGTAVEQCGNGIRCLAMYLAGRGESNNGEVILSGPAGNVLVKCTENGAYRVNMGPPSFAAANLPLEMNPQNGLFPLETSSGTVEIGAVALGNPHAVIVDRPAFDATLGAEISAHPAFPDGCNAGFANVINRGEISLEVFERGTGPTLACGTGACAATAVLRLIDRVDERVVVAQPGGQLVIEWPGIGRDLWMSGPAAFVYKGQTDL